MSKDAVTTAREFLNQVDPITYMQAVESTGTIIAQLPQLVMMNILCDPCGSGTEMYENLNCNNTTGID